MRSRGKTALFSAIYPTTTHHLESTAYPFATSVDKPFMRLYKEELTVHGQFDKKGKPAENQGRKASSLRGKTYDSGAARKTTCRPLYFKSNGRRSCHQIQTNRPLKSQSSQSPISAARPTKNSLPALRAALPLPKYTNYVLDMKPAILLK